MTSKRVASLYRCLLCQPRANIVSHWLNNFVAGVITLKLNLGRAPAQLRGVIGSSRRGIKLVPLTTQMKCRRCGWLVKFTCLPIAGYAAADSDHSAQNIWVRECEAIIQR